MLRKAIPSLLLAALILLPACGEAADSQPAVTTAQEAGEMLGVCERTLYRWRRAGYIEGVRIGGVIKYRRSACRAILADGKTE